VPLRSKRIDEPRELMEKLWYANFLLEDEGDGGLEGVMIACRAMRDFIAVRHENPELPAPFLSVAQAIEDSRNGVTPDLFSTSYAKAAPLDT
jgi:hypothetical protein